tara:strand:- start:238 stop:432 length:195 start_codon:yes stop_codon:yes gene_type:complete
LARTASLAASSEELASVRASLELEEAAHRKAREALDGERSARVTLADALQKLSVVARDTPGAAS